MSFDTFFDQMPFDHSTLLQNFLSISSLPTYLKYYKVDDCCDLDIGKSQMSKNTFNKLVNF